MMQDNLDHPISEWKKEVAEGNTFFGYAQWLENETINDCLEDDLDD